MKRFLNLEINEVPPIVLRDFMALRDDSYFNLLAQHGRLHIFSTLADDIVEERLYPAQTWASMNTGLSFDQHRCYWYSDPLPHQLLIWNDLVEKGMNVGIIGSLHSSKLPHNLSEEKKYNFYIPDCFSTQVKTKPEKYNNFQRLNIALVAESARVTHGKSLIIQVLKHIPSLLNSPSNYGISVYSLKAMFKIFRKFISSGNKEVLRMMQFPLLGSIFYDLNRAHTPEYSSLFSNHVAGNMHRYWCAYRPQDYSTPPRYSKKWMASNSTLVTFSIEILDDYLKILHKSDFAKNSTILVTASMGQSVSPFSSDMFMAKFDGRISCLKKFLECFQDYAQEETAQLLEISTDSRNMAPQYGFTLKRIISAVEEKKLIHLLGGFVNTLGLLCDISISGSSLVLTIDPYTDEKFHSRYDEKSASQALNKYGFEFFPISDHHSGSHSKEGILLLIDPDPACLGRFQMAADSNGRVSYLRVKELIVDSVISSK